MGTRLDVIMHGVERDTAEQAFRNISGSISELENRLSRFDENSPISMINRLASKQAVIVSEEVYSVLELCLGYYKKTSGIFDMSLGKITAGMRRGSHDASVISEMLKGSGMDKIFLDPEKGSVRFLNEQVEVDLGGFGKGYALDRAVGKALEFAEKDGETLVIVTADHETGGLTVLEGGPYNREVEGAFSTGGHTGLMVPVFTYGPGAEKFAGIYENTMIFNKMKSLLDL